MAYKDYIVTGKGKISLKKDFDPRDWAGFKNEKNAIESFEADAKRLGTLQNMMFAGKQYGVLGTVDGRDTAGKSTFIKHLLSRINATGAFVRSHKAPSAQELLEDFWRRYHRGFPDRGIIGLHDRSVFEEFSTVVVHPEYLQKQNIPTKLSLDDFFKQRFGDMLNIERYCLNNGFPLVRIYLHISKEEQKKRLDARLRHRGKYFKYSVHDLEERKYFYELQDASAHAINRLSTPETPTYVLPADNKWVARALGTKFFADRLEVLGLEYPKINKAEQRKQLVLLRRS